MSSLDSEVWEFVKRGFLHGYWLRIVLRCIRILLLPALVSDFGCVSGSSWVRCGEDAILIVLGLNFSNR